MVNVTNPLCGAPALLLAAVSVNGIRCQTAWTQLPVSVPATQIIDAQVAYDECRQQLVVVGSTTNSSIQQVWVLGASGSWVNVTPANAPTGRTEFGLANDGCDLILFGGKALAGQLLDDTWIWDGTNWTQATKIPGSWPSARYGHAMAADRSITGGGAIMYGGKANLGTMQVGTWRFNKGTQTWTSLGAQASDPALRTNALCSYIETPTGLVGMAMMGGIDGAGAYVADGMHIWNDTTLQWTQMLALPPEAQQRQLGVMTYDFQRQRIIVSGGTGPAGSLTDTWEYDDLASTWLQRSAGPAPIGSSGIPYFDGAYRTDDYDCIAVTATGTHRYAVTNPPSYTTSGTPCSGQSTPVLSVPYGEFPWVGEVFDLEVFGLIPGNATSLLFDTQSSAPIPFGSCTLYVDPASPTVILLPMPNADAIGRSAIGLPLPNNPAFVGTQFYNQALHADPAGPSGLAMSDKGTATIGGK